MPNGGTSLPLQSVALPRLGANLAKGRKMNELIRKIELILIETGQHDKNFKLGDPIKYMPCEVAKILREHIDELRSVLT